MIILMPFNFSFISSYNTFLTIGNLIFHGDYFKCGVRPHKVRSYCYYPSFREFSIFKAYNIQLGQFYLIASLALISQINYSRAYIS